MSGLGNQRIYTTGTTNPTATSLVAGNLYSLVYNGTAFIIGTGPTTLPASTNGIYTNVSGTPLAQAYTNVVAEWDSGCLTAPSTKPLLADGTCATLSSAYTAITGVLANSILGNNTGSTANAIALTAAQVETMLGLAITSGKVLTVTGSMTQSVTDGSTVAFGAGGTVIYNGGAAGTPSSINLASGTALPAAGVVGTAVVGGGNITTAGCVAIEISSGTVTCAAGITVDGSGRLVVNPAAPSGGFSLTFNGSIEDVSGRLAIIEGGGTSTIHAYTGSGGTLTLAAGGGSLLITGTTLSSPALKTTGAATGKTVLCVDVTTGIIYPSTSGVACAN